MDFELQLRVIAADMRLTVAAWTNAYDQDAVIPAYGAYADRIDAALALPLPADRHPVLTGVVLVALRAVSESLRESAHRWRFVRFGKGAAFATLTLRAEEIEHALVGLEDVTATHALVLSIAAMPIGLPALEALTGMVGSIEADEGAHYAACRLLDGFLGRYGTRDEAESASTEEGEAFGLALALLERLDVSKAERHDPEIGRRTRTGAIVPVAG